MKYNMWNHVVNKKVLNEPKHVLYFRFFKVNLMTALHTFGILHQLHEVVTWSAFALSKVH